MRRKLAIISLIMVLAWGTLTACGDNEGDEEEDDGRVPAPYVALVQP